MRGELCSPLAGGASSPLSNPLVREPCRLTPCEARSYNRLAPYTCGTGAGSWAELPPCEGGNRSYKHYTCVHCTLYSCLRLSLYRSSVLPKNTVIPTQDTTKPFFSDLIIKLYKITIQALKCLKSHSGRSHQYSKLFLR